MFKLKLGRYCVEKYNAYGCEHKQFRIAVIITENGFDRVATTAISMQLDEGRGYAVKITSDRYLDSFGNREQEWLNDKLVRDFKKYINENHDQANKIAATLDRDMAIHVRQFLDKKLGLLWSSHWDEAYKLVNGAVL